MVTNIDFVSSNAAELNDLLRRRSLKFAYVIAPFNADSCEEAMEQYEIAKMFACTKDLLVRDNQGIKIRNKLTDELNCQVSNIISRKTEVVVVKNRLSWEQYKSIKERILAIKRSAWTGEDRDNFILSTLALLKRSNRPAVAH
jgi:hypothetical protein